MGTGSARATGLCWEGRGAQWEGGQYSLKQVCRRQRQRCGSIGVRTTATKLKFAIYRTQMLPHHSLEPAAWGFQKR